MPCYNFELPASRREFLEKAGSGFGALALAALTGESILQGASTNPAASKIPHRLGNAKSVIWLFMEGGPSHIDLFDPKPLLSKLAGQKLPDSFDRPVTAMGSTPSSSFKRK